MENLFALLDIRNFTLKNLAKEAFHCSRLFINVPINFLNNILKCSVYNYYTLVLWRKKKQLTSISLKKKKNPEQCQKRFNQQGW